MRSFAFTLLLTLVASLSLTAQSWTGTWQTSYGELRLVQDGKQVYGDYGNKGPIAATFDPVTQELSGTFKNNGQEGHLTLFLNGSSFRGRWGWKGKSAAGNWNGSRSSAARPVLKFGKPQNPYAPSYNSTAVADAVKRTATLKTAQVGNYRKINTAGVAGTRTANASNTNTAPVRPIRGRKVTLDRKTSSNSNPRPTGKRPVEEENDNGYICITTQYEVDASFDKNYILSGSQSMLYPGSVINGGDFSDGRVNPTGGVRQPYTISPSYGGRGARVATDDISEVRDVLKSNVPRGTTPARMISSSTIVKSDKDLRLFLSAGYDDGMTDVKGSVSYNSREKRHVVASQFLQVYYNVTVDKPQMDADRNVVPGAVYKDRTSISPDEMIVSDVGYGRQIILLTETTYSSSEVDAMLKFVGSYTGTDITADMTAKHKKIVETSKFNAFVMGGSAEDGARVITSKGEALHAVIRSGAQFGPNNPGVPVYYKLRFLKDWSEASVKFTSTINKTECTRVNGRFAFSFDHYGVINAADGGGNEEMYGIGWVRLSIPHATNGTTHQQMPENFTYLDRWGRVAEIPPSQPYDLAQGDSRRISMPQIIFEAKASDHGYNTFDEMAKEAYFEVQWEAKEEDPGSDDMLGKAKDRIYLKDAVIDNRRVGRWQVVKQSNKPGALTAFNGSTRPIVLYSITPQ